MQMGGEQSLCPMLSAHGWWPHPPPFANMHTPPRAAARGPQLPPLDGAGGGCPAPSPTSAPSQPPQFFPAQGTAVWPAPPLGPHWHRGRASYAWPSDMQSRPERSCAPHAACKPQVRPSNEIKSNQIPQPPPPMPPPPPLVAFNSFLMGESPYKGEETPPPSPVVFVDLPAIRVLRGMKDITHPRALGRRVAANHPHHKAHDTCIRFMR